MVLELKVPGGSDLTALRPLLPVFSSYLLSFLYVGIYWNNHHHMFHAVHVKTQPKSAKRNFPETKAARRAPLIAPTTVAVSRSIPRRMFEMRSRTYVEAAPLEVATTATIDAAMACRSGDHRADWVSREAAFHQSTA